MSTKLGPIASQPADDIAKRIEALNVEAERFGRACGIPMSDFDLAPPPVEAKSEPSIGFDLAAALRVVSVVATDREYVSLLRHGGAWGLWFHRRPTWSQGGNGTLIPLREAPLLTRSKFLTHAKRFFEAYVAVTQNRTIELQQFVAAGDEALSFIRSQIHIEFNQAGGTRLCIGDAPK